MLLIRLLFLNGIQPSIMSLVLISSVFPVMSSMKKASRNKNKARVHHQLCDFLCNNGLNISLTNLIQHHSVVSAVHVNNLLCSLLLESLNDQFSVTRPENGSSL